MTDNQIEQQIQAKGLTAPRVTPADLEASIATEHYFTGLNSFNREGTWKGISDDQVKKSAEALSLITFCVLVLRNGHRIVGVNTGPVSPDNFNAELGRTLARKHAIDQIWPLMGYALREKLHTATPTHHPAELTTRDPKTMKATYLEVRAGVRHWEDATVNGTEDDSGTLIPGRVGQQWCPVIRLSDGLVMDWPQGTTADVHYKVSDAGEYWLLDDERKRVAKWQGFYVPDDFLCHGDNGYGDYIILKVGSDGLIRKWHTPEIKFVCPCEENEQSGWAHQAVERTE